MKNRIDNIINGYKKGLNLRQLAKLHSISHQRVSQLLVKNYPDYSLSKEQNHKSMLLNRRKNYTCKFCGNKTEPLTESEYKVNPYCSKKCRYDKREVMFRRPEGVSDTEFNRLRRNYLYKNYPKYKKMFTETVKRSEKRYPEKRKARQNLNFALKTGKVIKPENCESCFKHKDDIVRLEAHHEDYTKHLDVKWLCTTCHRRADRNML